MNGRPAHLTPTQGCQTNRQGQQWNNFALLMFIFAFQTLVVCVTGAAGQIAYALLPAICDGSIFGVHQVI